MDLNSWTHQKTQNDPSIGAIAFGHGHRRFPLVSNNSNNVAIRMYCLNKINTNAYCTTQNGNCQPPIFAENAVHYTYESVGCKTGERVAA
jgi:hypothetical protein